VTAAELEAVFAEFMRLDCWQSASTAVRFLAAAKNLDQRARRRLCQAAETEPAPRRVPTLSRYDADLVVPRRQLLECALLKAGRRALRDDRKDAVTEQRASAR